MSKVEKIVNKIYEAGTYSRSAFKDMSRIADKQAMRDIKDGVNMLRSQFEDADFDQTDIIRFIKEWVDNSLFNRSF